MKQLSRQLHEINFPSNNISLDEEYLFQIWILKTSGYYTSVNLLYSWMIPDYSGRKGWQESSIDFSKSTANDQGSLKIELIRADYIGKGATIKKYINELLKGKHLSEADAEETSHPPTALLNLNLGSGIKSINQKYAIRPEVFLPVEHLLIPWRSKALPSPGGYGCFVQQVICLDHKQALVFLEKLESIEGKNMLLSINEKLRSLTNFDFTKASAPRLGNIEWFRFPVSDIDKCSLINFGAVRVNERNATIANVSLEGLPAIGNPMLVLVRCRLINGEEVSLDEIKEAMWGHEKISLTYESKQPISDIAVTVWRKDEYTGAASLLYEQSYPLIRVMTLGMSIVSSSYDTSRVNLLNKLRKGDEEEKRKELAKFHRSSKSQDTVVGGYEFDPWVDTSRSALEFMDNLFPEHSEGNFFLNGWDESQGQSGQLSFFEWILKVISRDEKGGLVVIDPFFDKDGIEIFQSSRTSNCKFRVLTCTQHRDSTEAETLVDGLTPHAVALREACINSQPLLQGLDFELLDLISPSGGKEQLFHDRYIVLTDSGGYPVSGYHLSNSIQGATRKSPLLVTPIPRDILPQVFNYIIGLIEPPKDASGKKTDIVKIYPLPDVKKINQSNGEKAFKDIRALSEIKNVRKLFSVLLADSSLVTCEENVFVDTLKRYELLDTEQSSIKAYNLLSDLVNNLGAALISAEQTEFDLLINAYGELLARAHPYDHEKIDHSQEVPKKIPYDMREELKKHLLNNSDFGNKLYNYANAFSQYTEPLNYRERQFGVFKSNSFEDGINNNMSHQDQFRESYGQYGLYNAVKMLVGIYPDKAQALLDSLLEEAIKNGWNEGSPRIRARLILMGILGSNFLSYSNRVNLKLQMLLLKDKNASIRAASSAAILGSLLYPHHTELSKEDLINALRDNLIDEEYRISIAYMVAELFIRGNNESRKNDQEDYLKLLLKEFSGNNQLVKKLAGILSGRLTYNHATYIQRNFLKPLVDYNVITAKFVFDIWKEIFESKLAFRESYNANSSDHLVDNFSSTTDVELTEALIEAFFHIDKNEQLNSVLNWITHMPQILAVIRQPFASGANFNVFDKSVDKLFWLNFIFEILMKSKILSEASQDAINKFISDNFYELEIAKRHATNSRGATISQLLNLKVEFYKDTQSEINNAK